ncbi:hypothetical protein [Kitasatospora acidiphila]|uniref:hypothetical protein n=1 Tax=Kitasatospora acidiphila TaxID=2567942 RepID=UPI001E2F2B2D|nr:hypothetical protein [Kitasatospora acidiphila]
MNPKTSALPINDVRISVLGPVTALVGGVRVPLGGRRPKALLAALLLAEGRWSRRSS